MIQFYVSWTLKAIKNVIFQVLFLYKYIKMYYNNVPFWEQEYRLNKTISLSGEKYTINGSWHFHLSRLVLDLMIEDENKNFFHDPQYGLIPMNLIKNLGKEYFEELIVDELIELIEKKEIDFKARQNLKRISIDWWDEGN